MELLFSKQHWITSKCLDFRDERSKGSNLFEIKGKKTRRVNEISPYLFGGFL